jgi:hypothetical protein
MMAFNKIIQIPEQPLMADNGFSQNNADSGPSSEGR